MGLMLVSCQFLNSYSHQQKKRGQETDDCYSDANMYLAEDRILCWELVSKRACKWKLHYVKSAYGITDVPDAVSPYTVVTM